jgi:predicted RNA-binding protein with PIN domain
MPWIVDGSNVLGTMRADLHGDEPKRELVRLLARFARAKRTKLIAVFDGPAPGSFARHLGSVTVLFSGGRTADDIIVERTSAGTGWNVVTADRQLAARIGRRSARVVAPAALMSEIETAEGGSEDRESGDWIAWFSDPENRTKF